MRLLAVIQSLADREDLGAITDTVNRATVMQYHRDVLGSGGNQSYFGDMDCFCDAIAYGNSVIAGDNR
jgi:hypothetical protein